jgi:small GTP-binding protein
MNIKTIILGHSGAGKTKFLNHLRNKNMKSYCPTIGVDYIVYRDTSGVVLQMWDTSGSDRFRSVVNNFLKGIDLCIFVYKDKASFETMMELISYVKREQHGKRYCILSFGLPDLGRQVADKYGFFFFHVNIEEKEECLRTLQRLCASCVDEQKKCIFLELEAIGKFQVEKKRDTGFCWFSFC